MDDFEYNGNFSSKTREISTKRAIMFLSFLILSFVNCIAQEKFKTLMEYNIKGISINDKLVCPVNGFDYGTIDYGIYKDRGFYFAIQMDNAVFGESITILETIDHESFNNSAGKGMNCTLKDLDNINSETSKGRFIENKEDGIIYLFITTKIKGKEATITYIITSKK
ncbi:MAG: hypothetical protein H6Q14_574 [Bacteroidetes bacterium]|nr:hypothetical protein [Bacteroidota bacterium]